MNATEDQRKFAQDIRWWQRVYLVTVVIWIGVVIANLFIGSPRLWNIGVALSVCVLFARSAHLSARLDLANANVQRLAEFVDERLSKYLGGQR